MAQIDYSEKYQDGKFEYRHVILPKETAKQIPKNRTLSDPEWRSLGVQQSRGWEHYACHRPEPHILLFRRPLGTVSTAVGCVLCMQTVRPEIKLLPTY
jgi:cyclin-dependent kinase regulatory subunit CKS1